MEMTKELEMALNNIISYLADGESWHRRIANQLRLLALRGFSRWHECESLDDSKMRTKLEKVLVDNLKFTPTVDMSDAMRSEMLKMSSANDFKAHFAVWLQREQKLIDALNIAINESRLVNMELYHKLCKIQEEVQSEVTRADIVYRRLDFASWNAHDIGVVSMLIHKHYEDHPGSNDFNIG